MCLYPFPQDSHLSSSFSLPEVDSPSEKRRAARIRRERAEDPSEKDPEEGGELKDMDEDEEEEEEEAEEDMVMLWAWVRAPGIE